MELFEASGGTGQFLRTVVVREVVLEGRLCFSDFVVDVNLLVVEIQDSNVGLGLKSLLFKMGAEALVQFCGEDVLCRLH